MEGKQPTRCLGFLSLLFFLLFFLSFSTSFSPFFFFFYTFIPVTATNPQCRCTNFWEGKRRITVIWNFHSVAYWALFLFSFLLLVSCDVESMILKVKQRQILYKAMIKIRRIVNGDVYITGRDIFLYCQRVCIMYHCYIDLKKKKKTIGIYD